jgi:class 3 adenylate cyclase
MFGYDEMLVLIGFQTARGPEAQPGHSIWHGGPSAWFDAAGFEKGNLLANGQVQRRLAAILAADVVGFSSLMERDEDGRA